MSIQVTYRGEPFPYIIVDDIYTEEELEVLWKWFDLLHPRLMSGDKTGSAKHFGELRKKNNGIFITHEELKEAGNTAHVPDIIEVNRKTFGLINQLKDSVDYNQWWIKNILTCEDRTLVSYYEDSDYYKKHNDCAEITALTWFYREPKRYEGGDFKFSDYGIPIECKNNRTLIFPSMIHHEVSEVKMKRKYKGKKLGRWVMSQFTWMSNEGPKQIVDKKED
tara:strand:- start:545 stop:1207 length:663 start_codon:yes stop_codon:yes gene_type:complete